MSTFGFQHSEYFNRSEFNNVLSALNHSSTYLALVNNEYIAIIPNKVANMKYLNSSVKIYGLNIIWGNPTAVTWITAVHVGVGFSTGIFVCFDSQESNKVIKHYHKCSVKSLFLHSPKYLNSMSNLWLLYEHGFLIMVDVSDILKDELNYIRYKLVNNTHINTFVILPFIYQPLETEYHDNGQNSAAGSTYDISFVVAGKEPALSLYNIGGTQHFENINKLAVFLRDRITNTVTKTIGNALFTLFGGVSSPELQLEDQHTAITSTMDFIDQKREIQRLSLSPDGLLFATSDSLGRVMLFDNLSMLSTLRVWKGNRDARVGWSYNNNMKHLVIYAPRLGLVSIWVLRHGPCLRTIAVNSYCHLHTVITSSGGGSSSRGEDNNYDSYPTSQCHLLSLNDAGCQLLPILPHTNTTTTTLHHHDQDNRSHPYGKENIDDMNDDQFPLEYRELTPLTGTDGMENDDNDMNIEGNENNEIDNQFYDNQKQKEKEEDRIMLTDNNNSNKITMNNDNNQDHCSSSNNTNISSSNTTSINNNNYDNLTVPSAESSSSSDRNCLIGDSECWDLGQRYLDEELHALDSYYKLDQQTQQELKQELQQQQKIKDDSNNRNRNNNFHWQDDTEEEEEQVPSLTAESSQSIIPIVMDISNIHSAYPYSNENEILLNTSIISTAINKETTTTTSATISCSKEYEYFERRTVIKILKRILTYNTTTAINTTTFTTSDNDFHRTNHVTPPKKISNTSATGNLSDDSTSIKLDPLQVQIIKLFSVIKSLQVLTDTLQILFEFEFKYHLNFNSYFHTKINGIISNIIQLNAITTTTAAAVNNNINDNNEVIMSLQEEYEIRESLLITYNNLTKGYVTTKNKTNNNNNNDNTQPDDSNCNITTINPMFMEPYQWLLRLINNCEKYTTTKMHLNNSNSNNNNTSHALYSVGYILNNNYRKNEIYNNSNSNDADIVISFSFFRTLFASNASNNDHRQLINDTDTVNDGFVTSTDIPSSISSSLSNSIVDNDNSTVFRTDQKSFNCSLILSEILLVLHDSRNCIRTTTTNSTPSFPKALRATHSFDKDTLSSLLSLLCSPLVTGECMSFPIRNAYENMTTGGPLGIFQLLPLLLGYMQLCYSPREMCELLTIPLVSSPLHRWLRDRLLELQALYQEWRVSNNYSILLHRIYGSDSHQLLSTLSEMNYYDHISHSNSYSHDWDSISLGITFDQIVSRLLLPCYLFIKQSPLLEYNLAFSTIILQILLSLQTLLEKRSYGNDILTNTLTDWQILISQLRVCLFLSIPYQYYHMKSNDTIEKYLENWKKQMLENQEAERQDIRTTDSHYANFSNHWDGINIAGNDKEVYLSVNAIEIGAVNIFTLLAEDTLDFTTHPEQAKLHELKCKQAYVKYHEMIKSNSNIKAQPSTKSATVAVAATDPGPLLAWQYSPPESTGNTSSSGPKVRWLELLQTVQEQDDIYNQTMSTTITTSAPPPPNNSINTDVSNHNNNNDISDTTITKIKKKVTANTTTTNTTTKKSKRNIVVSEKHRRPLLLFFPLHNQMEALTAHRSYLLANKWKSNIEKIKYLSLACSHLTTAPHLLKITVGNHICRQVVLPVLQYILLQLDSNSSLGHHNNEEQVQHEQKKDIIEVVTAIIDELVIVIMELLQLSDQLPLLYGTSNTSTSTSAPLRNTSNQMGTWPAVSDPLFGPLVTAASLFLKDKNSKPTTATTTITSNSPTSTIASSLPNNLIANDNTTTHKTTSLLLQDQGSTREQDKTYKNYIIEILFLLRLSCHNKSIQDWNTSHGGHSLCSLSTILIPTITTNENNNNNVVGTGNTSTINIEGRLAFIKKSIVTVIGPPAKSILLDDIYQLSQLWGFPYDTTSVIYVELILKVLSHMKIQTKKWDETVENIISKISNPNLFLKAVKMLIAVLRNYYYYMLYYMERQVKYGVLIASLDLESVLWIQDSWKPTKESTSNNIFWDTPDTTEDLSQNVRDWLHTEESNGQEQLTHIITLLQYVQSRLCNICDMYHDIEVDCRKDSVINSNVTSSVENITTPTTTKEDSHIEKRRKERMEIESLLLYIQALLNTFCPLTTFLSKL